MEENIHEVATETVSHVRRQERQLVCALQAMCGVDDETLVETKKALSEHVRRLEDACDTADQLLLAVTEDRRPAAFLLQRRRTVDAMTSPTMASQRTGVADWPTYQRQVRFEAYGLDSALGLRVGRLIVDDGQSGCEQNERDGVTSPRVDGNAEWIEVTFSDKNVQTDELDQSVTPSSRCEASGSVSAPTTRPNVSYDQHVVTGAPPPSTRCRPAPPPPTSPPPPAAVCDASTSTPTVHVVSSSTATDQLQTCDESTYTDLSTAVITRRQQTSMQLLPQVHHRAAGTDPTQTRSVGVTAAPPTDVKSTSTVHSNDHTSSDAQSKLTDVDDNSTQTSVDDETWLYSQQTPARSCAGDSVLGAESLVTCPQPTPAATHSSSSPASSDLAAGLHHLASALKTGDCRVPPAVRLTALLPEIERTADVLSASHFSSGLTARLLREVVDVGLQMSSSCTPVITATNTADDLASGAAHRRHDSKWTQTEAMSRDVVHRGVGQSVVTTNEVSTLANFAPKTFDKETSTTRTHQVNKNVATDSLSTADKQTWMAIDVATTYLACTATRRAVSVSRGTLTPAAFSQPPTVDRATSPVRVTLVDKSVTASRAEALEPVDTFQAAGQLSGPLSPRTRRPLSLSPRSRLACISETAERYDEEEKTDVTDAFHRPTSELSDVYETRSALTSTQLPTTCKTRPLQQPQVSQLSRNVFNFDNVVTPGFGTLSTASQHSESYDDHLTSSAACDATSAAELSLPAVVRQSLTDEQ